MNAPAATLVYVAITLALYRELLPRLGSALYFYAGDPLLNATIMAWNAMVVPLTGAWWNFPSFAPLEGTTAFTEHLLLTYPLATPLIWITGNPILVFNLLFLLAYPLNALCAYALAREVTGSREAAFVGGLAFASAPYMAVHTTHLQTMLAFGLPLTLLGLHRWVRAKTGTSRGSSNGPVAVDMDATPVSASGNVRLKADAARDAAREDVRVKADATYGPAARSGVVSGFSRTSGLGIFSLGWMASALQTAYMLAFMPILVALWSLWFVGLRQWRKLLAPASLAVLVVVLLLPLLLGYARRQEAHGMQRTYDEVMFFSADLTDIVRPYDRLVVWPRLLPASSEEGALFPGLTITVLAAVALWAARRNRTAEAARASSARVAWFYAFAVVVMWFIALGPELRWNGSFLSYGPYRLLMELPGMLSLRVPPRAWLLAALCLSVLAALGAAALAARFPRLARPLMLVLAVGVVTEGWFAAPIAEAPEVSRLERAIPSGATVLDLPLEQGFWNAIPQYKAVMAGYRTVAGYSGWDPPHFQPLRQAIADLQPEALERYRRQGDLYVIVRPEQTRSVAEWIAMQPGAERLFEIGTTVLYRLPRR